MGLGSKIFKTTFDSLVTKEIQNGNEEFLENNDSKTTIFKTPWDALKVTLEESV